MAKRKGLGNSGFASGNAGPNANQPTTTAPVRGAAARANKIGRRGSQRNGLQGRRQNSRARDTGGPGPFDDDPIGGADSIGAALAFEDMDTRREAAFGMLNNAGIGMGGIGPGSNQADWLDQKVDVWNTEHVGNILNNDPTATWENALYGRMGLPQTGAAATDPAAAAAALGPEPNKKKNPNQWQRWKKAQQAAAAAPPPTTATPTANVDWSTMGQTARDYLSRDYWADTARNRGYDSRSFVAPKRVIQF